jgi:hypothetical protein
MAGRIGPLPPIPTLTLYWYSISSIPVANPNSLSDWNTYFDLPTNGTPFTSVEVMGNAVYLKGGSDIVIADNLFAYNIDLYQVNDTGCVTSLGTGCFSQSGITDIYMEKVEVAGNFAFDSSAIITVNMPALIIANQGAFSNCINITSIILPSLQHAGTSCFDSTYVFGYVDFPNLLTAGANCFAGSAIDNPNFPVLSSIGDYCFNYCQATTISLPSLTSMGVNAFESSYYLETISLPIITTVGVNAFYNCGSLINVSLPAAILVDIYAFYGCINLSTISLPSATTIGYECFDTCSSLSTISLPACTDLGGDIYDDAVFNNINLQTISLTVPTALMNAQGAGIPDGDIETLQLNNTVTVHEV